MKSIPSVSELLDIALKSLGSDFADKKWLGRNFCQAILTFESTAYDVYLKNEKKAFETMIVDWLKIHAKELQGMYTAHGDQMLNEFLRPLLVKYSPLAIQWEFRSAQRRKARGGKSLEKVLATLLRNVGVQCELPKGKARTTLKRIDLVLPDQQTALSSPDRAHFISCKRTLRERWKQTIPEREPSWRVYLVTLDDNLPEDKADEIHQLGMIAYVPDDLKKERHLSAKEWIRPLSTLPRDLER